jgi:uncharacterized delta-60 repeat protein
MSCAAHSSPFDSTTRRVLSAARLLPWLALLPLLAMLPSGCCDDDEDSSSDTSDREIKIEEERDWSTDDNQYEWNSPGQTARVTLKIDDFHHGDFRLTIYDAGGHLIYLRYLYTYDWYWFYGDWEVDDVGFTESGDPGLWTILLEYHEFTGEVDVLVETTEEEPPPPPDTVPPPTENSSLLDLAFGDDGRAAYTPGLAYGRKLGIDSSRRLLVAGLLRDSENRKQLGVWRFLSGGQLDTSFGTGGLFTYDVAAASAGIGLTVDPVNRAIVSGWVADDQARTDIVLLRLTTLGTLDTSFGTGGVVTLDAGGDETGNAVGLDGPGNIVVAGVTRDLSGARRMLLARYSTAGVLDGSFGSGGIVTTSGPADMGLDVALDSSNRPIVAGSQDVSMALWKFTDSGAADVSFGVGGVVTSTGASGEIRVAQALAVAPDGSLGATGVLGYDNGDPVALGVWRFDGNGNPLPDFNVTGFASFKYSGGTATGADVTFDSEGRVLVVGGTRSTDKKNASATLWRFKTNGKLDGDLRGSGGKGYVRFDARSNDVSTRAGSIAIGSGGVFAAGGARDANTEAVDLLVWKLLP